MVNEIFDNICTYLLLELHTNFILDENSSDVFSPSEYSEKDPDFKLSDVSSPGPVCRI